jgi:hypothetical protein
MKLYAISDLHESAAIETIARAFNFGIETIAFVDD